MLGFGALGSLPLGGSPGAGPSSGGGGGGGGIGPSPFTSLIFNNRAIGAVGSNQMSDREPLDTVVRFDLVTSIPSTGEVSDADSTPTFEVFEDATDTDIGVGGNLTKRTSKTGNYRGSFTASAANGFEVGKRYAVVASATVDAIAGKTVAKQFIIVPAEGAAGIPKVHPNTHVGRFTASAVGAQTFTLNGSPVGSAEDDIYNKTLAHVVGGTLGVGQSEYAVDYDGTTKVLTLQAALPILPTGTVVIDLYAAGMDPAGLTEVAQAVRQEMDDNSTKLQALGSALADVDTAVDAILALLNDATTEPGQGQPPETATRAEKIDWIYKFLINIKNQSAEELQLMNFAGTQVDQKSSITVNAGVVTRGQVVSGP